MQLSDIADDAGLDHLDGASQAAPGAALVAHLRGHFLFLGHLAHEACLVDGLGEWFLDVHVFAHLHGRDGGDGMHVIRGGHRDGIDGLLLFEHLAEVLICGGPGIFFATSPQPAQVHVAQRDDVGAATRIVVRVAAALAAGADGGNVDFAVQVFAPENEGAKCGGTQRCGGVRDELAA